MPADPDEPVLMGEGERSRPSLPEGARVGPYVIRSELGRGGMGVVYRALDEALGREVALKVLPLHPARGREALKRFVLEARTLARLDHPNITPVYAHGRSGDVVYIAAQLVTGERLSDLIGRDGPVPWRAALRVARDIAAALEAAHAVGVLHRDIKTDNVMVEPSGRVKLLDFGIAQDLRAPHRITQEHHCVGTAEYCSPEQLRAEELDGRADLYALGVVLYEMLTGDVPHKGRSTVELYERIRTRPIRSPRDLDPGIPRAVVSLTRRLLRSDRERRPSGARQVIRELDALLARSEGPGPATRPWSRWLVLPPAFRRPAAMGALLAGSGTTGAALAWLADRLLA